MSQPIITLITDFGHTDGYVGTMKGVMLGICPRATLVDITHEIHPQAIEQAAYVLSTAAPHFPPGTVHLVVVDPGVGGERRPIAVQTGRALYVAPDNGVLSLALAQDPARQAIHLSEDRYHLARVSATFHGRDIFAPVAAHLACGTDVAEMGEPLQPSELFTLPISKPQQRPDGSWLGQVLHIDRFGNLITNLPPPEPGSEVRIVAGGQQIDGLSHTFADVEPGQLVAYLGSSGYLEIGVREGSAASRLDLALGAPVEVCGLS